MVIDRKLKVFLTAAALLIAVGVYAALRMVSNGTTPAPNQGGLIEHIDTHLSAHDQAVVRSRIADYQTELTAQAGKEGVNLSELYLNLGNSYQFLGELEHARQAYLKAAQQNPFIAVPWGNLGTLYQTMGSPALAKAALEKAVLLEPTITVNWGKLIDLTRYKLGGTDTDLRALFARAFKATSNELDLHRTFARYLEDVGDIAGAKLEWRYVLSHDPKDQVAKLELARLSARP